MEPGDDASQVKLRDELITALVAKRFTLALSLLDLLLQQSTNADERVWIVELRETIERDHGIPPRPPAAR